MEPKFLRRPAVSARYGLPASTLYALIAKGHFPRPVQLGLRAVGWSVAELDAWERAKTEDRDRGG